MVPVGREIGIQGRGRGRVMVAQVYYSINACLNGAEGGVTGAAEANEFTAYSVFLVGEFQTDKGCTL